ncbi:MAG: nucleotidyltransferase domain-containing protein [Nitrospirae bacterium]|nr:nucleotidyltransferase domain-containing protein [Nitrospirota bacterium]
MSLIAVLQEREKRLRGLRENAIIEAERLASLLRKRFDFDVIYLFGSVLTGRFRGSSDIDMVIKGMKIEDFFKAYACIIKEARYRVDLKPFEDLSEELKERISIEGKRIG